MVTWIRWLFGSLLDLTLVVTTIANLGHDWNRWNRCVGGGAGCFAGGPRVCGRRILLSLRPPLRLLSYISYTPLVADLLPAPHWA